MDLDYKVIHTEEHPSGLFTVEHRQFKDLDQPLVCAIAMDGGYIGIVQEAEALCVQRGIKPELISSEYNVCSIGFCQVEQKWYGWSHRAIYGFGVGDSVKIGDCAFKASDTEEFAKAMELWYSDPMYSDVVVESFLPDGEPDKKTGLHGVRVSYRVVNNSRVGSINARLTRSTFEPYPDEWGRGEWVAETLEDAKQMAINFAKGVS